MQFQFKLTWLVYTWATRLRKLPLQIQICRTSPSNYNHGQKQLRHSSKKTCFVKRVSFSISNLPFSTPSPLFNVVTTWQCQPRVLQHWKGGERQKRCFLNLCKDAEKKRLFCSNVSTLLSMIVATSFVTLFAKRGLLRKSVPSRCTVTWLVLLFSIAFLTFLYCVRW